MDASTREQLQRRLLALVAGIAMIAGAAVVGVLLPVFSLNLVLFALVGFYWCHRVHPNPMLSALVFTLSTLGLAWFVMLGFADDLILYGNAQAIELASMGANLFAALAIGALLRRVYVRIAKPPTPPRPSGGGGTSP